MKRFDNIKTSEKSHRWCFTCWDFNTVMTWKVHKMHLADAMAVGVEICPTTRRLHYQGYIRFKKEYNFSSVKRIWPDNETHWEIARANEEVCFRYCLKDGQTMINTNEQILRKVDWDDVFQHDGH